MISVVVPVYQAEKHLNKMLESIQKQSYTDLQVILINDGSLDNSKDICETFCKMDSRFNLYNIENHGVSYVRNLGIKYAKGEYISFLDSDDEIDSQYYEKMIYKMQQGFDLVICGYHTVTTNGEKSIDQITTLPFGDYYDYNEFILDTLKFNTSPYYNYIWNKLYKKSIIEKYEIFYDETISFGEDMLFNMAYMKYVNKVGTLKDSLYYYYIRKNEMSLSRKISNTFIDSQLKMSENWKKFYQTFNFISKKQIEDNLIKQYINRSVILLETIAELGKKGKSLIPYVFSKDEIRNAYLNSVGLPIVLKSFRFCIKIHQYHWIYYIYTLKQKHRKSV